MCACVMSVLSLQSLCEAVSIVEEKQEIQGKYKSNKMKKKEIYGDTRNNLKIKRINKKKGTLFNIFFPSQLYFSITIPAKVSASV